MNKNLTQTQSRNAAIPPSDLNSVSSVFQPKKQDLDEVKVDIEIIQKDSLDIHVILEPQVENRIVSVSLFENGGMIAAKERISSSTEWIRVAFNDLFVGKTYTVIASASGYVPTHESTVINNEHNQVDLSIFQQPILSLTVKNETNEPVPGAEIKLRSKSHGIFTSDLQTNDRGYVETELPYTGDYEIMVSHPIYAETAHKTLRIDRNPNQQTIVLPGKTGMIFGRAVDEHDKPIQNINIWLLGSSKYNTLAKIETTPDGKYAFNALRLSNYYLNIDAGDAYIKSDISYSEEKKKDAFFPPISLTPDAPNAEVNFVLIPAVQIKGKVVTKTNQPVSGAIIKAGIQGTRMTSVRPVFEDILSDIHGDFTFPITTRVDGWTTLLLSAIHPEYGYKTETVERYAERAQNETFILTLKKSVGVLKGSVKTFRTKESVPSVPLEIVSYAFQNDERFRHAANSDENGNFDIELAEDRYLIRAEGFTVKTPQSVSVNSNRETEITVIIEREDEEKTLIQGIVVNADHAPIHGVRIFVNNGDHSLGETISNPDGKFNFTINASDIRENSLFKAYHQDYKTFEKPLSDISDYAGIIAVLQEQQGALKVVLTGIEDVTGVKIHLINKKIPFKSRTYEKIDGTTVFIRKIDESLSPFYMMAANTQYAGISPIFDLQNVDSRYLEIEIPMQPIGASSNVEIQVVDEQTGEPIQIATCEIRGSCFSQLGTTARFNKKMITLSNGIAVLKDIPLCIGSLSVRHIYYEETTIPFFHDGIQKNRIETIRLKRREK